MGFLSRLFGKEEVTEEPQPVLESKENKDIFLDRIGQAKAYITNELRPELLRAQQKKWVRATFSDFRNFHLKIREGRTRIEKETARMEAVPFQNPEYQEYARNIVAFHRRMAEELKIVEDQLSGERNITEITNHLTDGLNIFEEFNGYWTSRVRSKFLD